MPMSLFGHDLIQLALAQGWICDNVHNGLPSSEPKANALANAPCHSRVYKKIIKFRWIVIKNKTNERKNELRCWCRDRQKVIVAMETRLLQTAAAERSAARLEQSFLVGCSSSRLENRYKAARTSYYLLERPCLEWAVVKCISWCDAKLEG